MHLDQTNTQVLLQQVVMGNQGSEELIVVAQVQCRVANRAGRGMSVRRVLCAQGSGLAFN